MIPCGEELSGSTHQTKGCERRGPRHWETTMPTYLLLERRESARPGQRRTRRTTRSSTDSKEREVVDPQEPIEKPQDRTGSWVRRDGEYTPQELARGRS